jgi:hypothetical protein
VPAALATRGTTPLPTRPCPHRTQLKDVGKGWYSLAEARWDTYNFSKLKRLLVRVGEGGKAAAHTPRSATLLLTSLPGLTGRPCPPAPARAPQIRVRLQQQDTLRDLALGSMERLLDFLQSAAGAPPLVRSTCAVDAACGGGGGCCSPHTPHIPGAAGGEGGGRRPVPLLSSELVADGASLGYATAPEAVVARVMALFERGLQRLQVGARGRGCGCKAAPCAGAPAPRGLHAQCSSRPAAPPTAQGLPDLEPLIMEHLFWPEPRTLACMHPDEPEAAAARAALAALLERALAPMREYLACWQR